MHIEDRWKNIGNFKLMINLLNRLGKNVSYQSWRWKKLNQSNHVGDGGSFAPVARSTHPQCSRSPSSLNPDCQCHLPNLLDSVPIPTPRDWRSYRGGEIGEQWGDHGWIEEMSLMAQLWTNMGPILCWRVREKGLAGMESSSPPCSPWQTTSYLCLPPNGMVKPCPLWPSTTPRGSQCSI
jgi:hypothetical protein